MAGMGWEWTTDYDIRTYNVDKVYDTYGRILWAMDKGRCKRGIMRQRR